MACFNPRTRVGCDDHRQSRVPDAGKFQSTHPRGVRPRLFLHVRRFRRVSIHAPAWGATNLPPDYIPSLLVSIHAPAWGATSVLITSATACACFNPRTRVGCDVTCCRPHRQRACFNPRTRVGCDAAHTRSSPRVSPVSIHAPAWGATPACRFYNAPGGVSIHAPAWGATSAPDLDACSGRRFQSTHPRGVRPSGELSPSLNVTVSIHAPAWGATLYKLYLQVVQYMFQSTHPRGVRPSFPHPPVLRSKFQSTHPRGVRRRWSWASLKMAFSFNPRTRVGCDMLARVSFPPSTWFQSTHPRGVRRLTSLTVNPHLLFQSTHPRGVRRASLSTASTIHLFQSTHPRGVRRPRTAARFPESPVSIHAPAWGATCNLIAQVCFEGMFQSTHPRGVRQLVIRHLSTPEPVSIHAPAWGATGSCGASGKAR